MIWLTLKAIAQGILIAAALWALVVMVFCL